MELKNWQIKNIKELVGCKFNGEHYISEDKYILFDGMTTPKPRMELIVWCDWIAFPVFKTNNLSELFEYIYTDGWNRDWENRNEK